MPDDAKREFDWKELVDLFCIRDGECAECQKSALFKRINGLSSKYGREYVVRKIALRDHQ